VSALNLAYAISKFGFGVLSDRVGAVPLFACGLVATALSVVGFAYVHHSTWLFALLWFLNGLGQGCGWPACSKLLRVVCSSKVGLVSLILDLGFLVVQTGPVWNLVVCSRCEYQCDRSCGSTFPAVFCANQWWMESFHAGFRFFRHFSSWFQVLSI